MNVQHFSQIWLYWSNIIKGFHTFLLAPVLSLNPETPTVIFLEISFALSNNLCSGNSVIVSSKSTDYCEMQSEKKWLTALSSKSIRLFFFSFSLLNGAAPQSGNFVEYAAHGVSNMLPYWFHDIVTDLRKKMSLSWALTIKLPSLSLCMKFLISTFILFFL